MIQPKLSGRLGNFLFEVAAAYAYSLKHGIDYSVVPIGGGVENGTIEKYLGWFYKIKTGELIKDSYVYEEPTHAFREIPFHKHIQIVGYFQSELYFKEYEKQIKDLFEFKTDFKKGVVSIHVRRGDYVKYSTSFPPIDRRYLMPAMNFFYEKGYKDFLVFSDGIDWCKSYLNKTNFQNYNFEYSEGLSEYDDMRLMSSCEHNIICNSTFSWWAAWLNKNENKIVVSPHWRAGNWFGQRVKLDTSTLIPDNWYKIKF